MSKYEPNWEEYLNYCDQNHLPQFKVGDIVRLNRGWTPMVVLAIEEDGKLLAKYANSASFPVCLWDYQNPRLAAQYDRHFSGYTAWDGKPIAKEHFIMTRRYRTISEPTESGVYLNNTSTGLMVLEMDNGRVISFQPHQLEEDIPNTFSVKALNNSYNCHYIVPNGVSMSKGDMLISDSGNVYVVTKLDTKNRTPKGVFKGSRVITESL
ncbi:MAG: hypothetical protein LC687_00660 [Actinobacteria bacterium]|nr:hypothetical protein [Actinomycetota bacterium]